MSESSIVDWESDKKVPLVCMWPQVMRFLGYYPCPEPKSLRERLLAARRRLGVCHRKAAKMLSVDEGTYLCWEQGKRDPNQDHLYRIERFLSSLPNQMPE